MIKGTISKKRRERINKILDHIKYNNYEGTVKELFVLVGYDKCYRSFSRDVNFLIVSGFVCYERFFGGSKGTTTLIKHK